MMILDRAFFSNISLDILRGKFYKKTDVDALLQEIAEKAELLGKENENLQLKLKITEQKISDAENEINNTRQIAQEIIGDAQREAQSILDSSSDAAETILTRAAEERTAILEDAEDEKRKRLEKMKDRQDAVIEKLSESIEEINDIWRTFLAGFEEDENGEESTPEDLSAKVEALASVMEDIGSEEEVLKEYKK